MSRSPSTFRELDLATIGNLEETLIMRPSLCLPTLSPLNGNAVDTSASPAPTIGMAPPLTRGAGSMNRAPKAGSSCYQSLALGFQAFHDLRDRIKISSLQVTAHQKIGASFIPNVKGAVKAVHLRSARCRLTRISRICCEKGELHLKGSENIGF